MKKVGIIILTALALMGGCKTKEKAQRPKDEAVAADSIAVQNSTDWIDLGLSSGTKWKCQNEVGLFDFESAEGSFGNDLPSKEQWEELEKNCQWTWMGNGYIVIGLNSNSIVLPAEGYRNCDGDTSSIGSYGIYWAANPINTEFPSYYFTNSDGTGIYKFDRCYSLSVRLVKK